MWFSVVRLLGRYGTMAMLPVVSVIGFIGYNLEGWISSRYTPPTAPIVQQRQERLLESVDSTEAKKKHDPLSVNLSPSLSQ